MMDVLATDWKRFVLRWGIGMVALVFVACGGVDKRDALIDPVGDGGDDDVVVGGVGRIAFIKRSSSDVSSFHVYMINPDGTNLSSINEESDLADYTGQSWSSDGQRMAFGSNRSGNANFNIYVMDIDGRNLREIVTHAGGDFAPSLSPDGQKILFQAHRADATQWDIFVVNTDGSGERALFASALDEQLPTWSPDGSRIAFQAGTDSTGTDIYVANADGSGLARLTDGNGRQHSAPAWSPDGAQIAFESNRHQTILLDGSAPVGEFEIYAMNADGSNVRQLTTGGNRTSIARNPTWSPDGRQIAFELWSATSDGVTLIPRLVIMNADGTNIYAIPNLSGGEIFPRWSPVP